MPYMDFLGRNLENLWSHLGSTYSNFKKCKFLSRNRNSLFLGLKKKIVIKNILIFEIATLGFVKFQSFNQDKNRFKLDSKNPFLGKFRIEFENIIVIFEISTFQFIRYKVSC